MFVYLNCQGANCCYRFKQNDVIHLNLNFSITTWHKHTNANLRLKPRHAYPYPTTIILKNQICYETMSNAAITEIQFSNKKIVAQPKQDYCWQLFSWNPFQPKLHFWINISWHKRPPEQHYCWQLISWKPFPQKLHFWIKNVWHKRPPEQHYCW